MLKHANNEDVYRRLSAGPQVEILVDIPVFGAQAGLLALDAPRRVLLGLDQSDDQIRSSGPLENQGSWVWAHFSGRKCSEI